MTSTSESEQAAAMRHVSLIAAHGAAFAAIGEERDRQVRKGRGADHDDKRSYGEWLSCLSAVLHAAEGTPDRAVWIKVGSVAVAAIESIDRKGDAVETCPRCHLLDCSPECIAAEQAEDDAYTGPRPKKFA